MADGILGAVAIGLIEQVHHSVSHQRTGSAQPILLIFGTRSRSDFTHLVPVCQVLTFGNAYVPSALLVSFPGRDGIVHQISAVQAHHMRVLGKGNTLA